MIGTTGQVAARGISRAALLGSGGGGGVVTPPPSGNVISVGGSLGTSNTRLGWTWTHNERRDSTTKALLATAARIQNQHLIGFGSVTDPQPGAGAAYNWASMDSTFGFPTSSTGLMSGATERCLTICGCPPHMRSPKAGQSWDPNGVHSGTQLTSLTEYVPPNHSWFSEYADLVAAFAVRYPHVKYFQVWNELKGFYVVNQTSGSSAIPPGSGLPAGITPLSNRWWYEGYTAMYNLIWQRVKAVRPDAFIVGPYNVLNTLSWDTSADWANDTFPDRCMGPWGYIDKKVLHVHRYFLANCTGADALCSDVRNLTKDSSAGTYYSIPSVPGAPDPTNKWTTNPEGGIHHRYWKEGQTVGAWNQGQKIVDWIQWVRDLGASSATYQRSVCDARTIPICFAEWYAYGQRNQFKSADPHTGNYYVESTSSHAEEASAFAWHYVKYGVRPKVYYNMAWEPEGKVQGNVTDAGDSNPLGLWYEFGSAQSLQPTELKAVCDALVANLPPGTALTDVVSGIPEVEGIATPTKLLLISRKSTPVTVDLVDPGKSVDGTQVTLNGYEVRWITR